MESALPEIIVLSGSVRDPRIGDDPETFCPRRTVAATITSIDYEFHGLVVSAVAESELRDDVSAGVGLAHTTLRR